MAFKIGKNCAKCGVCESICRMNAITEKNGKFTIDKKKCTECGECQDICPMDCVKK